MKVTRILYLILLAFQFSNLNAKTNDQQQQLASLFDLSLEELLSIQVRVANRYPTELLKVPSSVTIFTAQQIEQMGFVTLEQLLTHVPGMQVVRGEEGGGNSSVSVRGRRSDTGVNRDLLILLDGLRLNEPITGGAMAQERQISLYNVERVEVIRGPGSALYGANAFLGVVNIISSKEQNKLNISAGSFNKKSFEFQLSNSENKWSWSLGGQYYDDSGQEYPGFYSFGGYVLDTQDPSRRLDLNLQLSYDEFSAIYRRSERENGDFILIGAQLNGLQRALTVNDSLRLQYDLGVEKHKMSTYLEIQKGLSDSLLGIFPFDPLPPPDPATGLYWTDGSIDAFLGGNIRTVRQKRAGLDAHWKINEKNHVAYGLVFRKESTGLNPFQGNWNAEVLETTGQLIPSSPDNFVQRGFYIGGVRFDLFNKESRNIHGIYIQNETLINSKWTLTMGLRNDNYEDFGGHTSIRSGLVYNAENSFWKLLYGEAFRAPSFQETRAGIAGGGIANPDLNPEIVETTELVWGTHSEHWNTTLTVYHNDFTDIVVPVLVDDVVPGFTAFQPQNIGKESNSGFEFEFHFQLSDNWQLNIGGDYIFDELKSQPVANKRVFTDVNYRKENWQLNLRSHYLGEVTAREADGVNFQQAVHLDDFWLTDINLRWDCTKSLTFNVSMSNILDEKHQSFSPQVGIESGLPGRGRETTLAIEYRW